MRRTEKLLESSGLLVIGFVALIVLMVFLALVEILLLNGKALVIGALLIGGGVAVLKFLPDCVEKIHAIRDRRKSEESEKRPVVKVLGFTADNPPTRAMRKSDARRRP